MFNKTVLDNGIRVISEQIDHVRSITIGVWVHCGSRYEDSKTNGLAHFIEHMLFKGTPKRSAFDIASAIDSVGGVMNAFTGKELTAFYITIPDYHLPLAIDLLADIFKNSLFEEAEIGKEKSVILQEIKMVEDTPDEYIHDFFEALFWKEHSLGLPVLGTKDLIKTFEKEALVRFFQSRYIGKNLVITAAGNLNHDGLAAMVEKAFDSPEQQPDSQINVLPDVSSAIAVMEKDLGQVHFVIGTLAPSAINPKRYQSLLLNTVLGGSMSSRLFQNIRENRGLVYAIHSYLAQYMDVGMLGIYAGVAEDNLHEVISLIFDELYRLCNDPLTDQEILSAKELLKGNYLLSMESTDNQMIKLAKNEICFGRNISMQEIIDLIEEIDKEGVRNLACEIFNPGNISIAAMGHVSENDLTLDIIRS
ncbi:MAG: insulinase family protein [Deltaproteobacteria bacterium]|nr:insulinase family protein [Deltaproteobacteria bacterium]